MSEGRRQPSKRAAHLKFARSKTWTFLISGRRGRDLLVRVHIVSVNTRDVKRRMFFRALAEKPVVLGDDAFDVVELFEPKA